MNFDLKKDGKRIIVVCLASIMMAANIKSFVRTGGLYPGGATGLTILIQRVADLWFHIAIPYSAVNIILNAIPVYIGFRFIGKKFTLYSCLMILLTGIFADVFPFYVITYDILLISIFGGMINGFVISMCLMMNATSGGTDFIDIFLSEKKGIDSWNIIFGLNVIILSAAGLLFGWDKALYSIIFQFTSTQVLHFLYKRYQKETLLIVTNKADEVCDAINNVSRHGSTILKGEGAYKHEQHHVVYSVVSKEESKQVIMAIKKADKAAFINSMKTEALTGRFYQKPNE